MLWSNHCCKCVVYRPPGASLSLLRNLEALLPNLITTYDDVILVGDFNIDFMVRDYKFSFFSDIITAFNLIQVIKDPTRVSDKSATLIDLSCISPGLALLSSGVIDLAELSDHHAIFLTFNCSLDHPKPQKKLLSALLSISHPLNSKWMLVQFAGSI